MDKTQVCAAHIPRRYPVMVITETGEPKTYSLSFQTDAQCAEGWKNVLRRARQEELDVLCDCPTPEEKHLSVHYITATDNYHLARYPESGQHHAPDCLYYSPVAELGENSSSPTSKTPHDDALLKVRLDIGLKKRGASAASHSVSPSSGNTDREASYPRLPLIRLINLLWDTAGLNAWTPNMKGKRNLDLIHWLMVKAADKVSAGGTLLSSVLLSATANKEGKQAKENAEKSSAASENSLRLVVVAPLAKYKEGMEGKKSLPIYGFGGIPVLMMAPHAWELLKKHDADAIEAWKAGRKVMSIVQTDVPNKGVASVLDIALMRVSEQWIPVQSDIEEQVTDKLVAEERRFNKPLITTTEQRKLPAFWLTDTGAEHHAPLVIIDAKTELARADYYTARYGLGNWWGWNGNGEPSELPRRP